MKIPDNIIEEIRARSDIVELVNSYVPLKQAGNLWVACCPFHQEKTPSFKVNPERQIFHCFGCGKGGNAFNFVMDIEGMAFPDAAKLLAQRSGVVIPERETHQHERPPGDISRERLYSLHEKIKDWFEKNLWEHNDTPVYRYFYGRKIPVNEAKKFGIGASPDSWDAALNWAKGEGYSEKELLAAGVVVQSQNNSARVYDRFRNRMMFPIWNDQGNVVAFSGRTVEKDSEGAKYVNSPETQIFRKSNVLYALPLARRAIQEKGFVIICEGQLDTIAMHRAGYENSVAPQGTAFTDEQARKLKRYTNTIYFAFDSDSAGIKAAARSIEIALAVGFEAKVIEFPEKKDPDDIFNSQGPEGISVLVEGAKDFFDFILRQLSLKHDPSSPAGKGRIVGEMIDYITKIHNSVTRSSYASQLGSRLAIPESAVFKELNRHRGHKNAVSAASDYSRTATQAQPSAAAASEVDYYSGLDANLLNAEESLLKLALAHGTVGKRLQSELEPGVISQTPLGKALEKAIQMTINGEWEFAQQSIIEDLDKMPDRYVTRVLADSTAYSHDDQEKAITHCVQTIQRWHAQRDLNETKRKLVAAANQEEKALLMKEYQEKSNKLLKIQNPQRYSSS